MIKKWITRKKKEEKQFDNCQIIWTSNKEQPRIEIRAGRLPTEGTLKVEAKISTSMKIGNKVWMIIKQNWEENVKVFKAKSNLWHGTRTKIRKLKRR